MSRVKKLADPVLRWTVDGTQKLPEGLESAVIGKRGLSAVTTAEGSGKKRLEINGLTWFPLLWFGVLQLGVFHEAPGGVHGAVMQTRLFGNRNASCVPSHSQRHEIGRYPGRRSGDGRAKGLLSVEMACCRRLRGRDCSR
jgi:hypothetical protein